ncbi:SDR family NAD(P)-dependent oxidoreductase [Kutzneria sp. 744]|uniref:SDR family NAD(P)-dependent oxidoreductase n=1 Tax=Kutzneria sp. (strain 744) TaxID=345341 RepID=UPI0018DBE6D4|nr:SDR family NAD(P)-dependent oxidoreductase [Kutzneria sp. 744]
MSTLDGRTALVTGAGRGLGRGIALALAAAGARVVLLSRTASEIDSAAEEIRAAGGSALAVTCDVLDLPRFEAVLDGVGEVDVLVNNAGTNDPMPFTEVTPATYDKIFDLNVRSTYFLTQAVVARMIAAGRGGSVITVSSQMGHVGAANRSVYCAAKHAVEGMIKALAVELGPHGIRVNAVAPGYVETPLTAPYFADEDFRADTLRRIPLGRLGLVREVAAAVVYLADPAAGFVTGASLVIDGGYTAQ